MVYQMQVGDVFFKKNGSFIVTAGQALSPATLYNANITHPGIVISPGDGHEFAFKVAEVTREYGLVHSSWKLKGNEWFKSIDGEWFKPKAVKININENEIPDANMESNTYYLFKDENNNICLKYKDSSINFNKKIEESDFNFLRKSIPTLGIFTKENIDKLFSYKLPLNISYDKLLEYSNDDDVTDESIKQVGYSMAHSLFGGAKDWITWEPTGVKREDLIFFRDTKNPEIHETLGEIAGATKGYIIAKKITVGDLGSLETHVKEFGLQTAEIVKNGILFVEYNGEIKLFECDFNTNSYQEKSISGNQYTQHYKNVFSEENKIVAVVDPLNRGNNIDYSDSSAVWSALLVMGKIFFGADKSNPKNAEQIDKILNEFHNSTFCSGFVAKCLNLAYSFSESKELSIHPSASSPAKLFTHLKDGMKWENFVIPSAVNTPPTPDKQERCIIS